MTATAELLRFAGAAILFWMGAVVANKHGFDWTHTKPIEKAPILLMIRAYAARLWAKEFGRTVVLSALAGGAATYCFLYEDVEKAAILETTAARAEVCVVQYGMPWLSYDRCAHLKYLDDTDAAEARAACFATQERAGKTFDERKAFCDKAPKPPSNYSKVFPAD